MKLTSTIATVLVLIGIVFFKTANGSQFPKTFEFKVMLKNSNFTSRDTGINDFKNIIVKQTGLVFEDDPSEKSRIVTYLDTKKCHLTNNNYILRKRFTLKKGLPDRLKVTLKFRGTDFDIVNKKEFEAKPSSSLTESKFEVDIIKDSSSPLMTQQKFSHSGSIELGKIKNLAQLISLYPVLNELKTDSDSEPKKIKLKSINKFPIFETLVKLGTVKVGMQTCDASFSFWYKTRDKMLPIVSEFSYVCKHRNDETDHLYQIILGLSSWVKESSLTKTEIAYGNFCK